MDSHASNKAVSSRSNISKEWVNKSEAARRMKISRRSVIRYARQGLIRENGSGAVMPSEIRDLLKKPVTRNKRGSVSRRSHPLTVCAISLTCGIPEKEIRRILRERGFRLKDGLDKKALRSVIQSCDHWLTWTEPTLAEKYKMTSAQLDGLLFARRDHEKKLAETWRLAIKKSRPITGTA